MSSRWTSTLVSPVFALFAACMPALAQNPTPTDAHPQDNNPAKPAVTYHAAKTPLITENKNGTFTVQHMPATPGAHKGLVIKPQVITPPIQKHEAPSKPPATKQPD